MKVSPNPLLPATAPSVAAMGCFGLMTMKIKVSGFQAQRTHTPGAREHLNFIFVPIAVASPIGVPAHPARTIVAGSPSTFDSRNLRSWAPSSWITSTGWTAGKISRATVDVSRICGFSMPAVASSRRCRYSPERALGHEQSCRSLLEHLGFLARSSLVGQTSRWAMRMTPAGLAVGIFLRPPD